MAAAMASLVSPQHIFLTLSNQPEQAVITNSFKRSIRHPLRQQRNLRHRRIAPLQHPLLQHPLRRPSPPSRPRRVRLPLRRARQKHHLSHARAACPAQDRHPRRPERAPRPAVCFRGSRGAGHDQREESGSRREADYQRQGCGGECDGGESGVLAVV